MNLVATSPVIPPLPSGPWHGTQNVAKRSLPIATEDSDAFTGFGRLAATSRCSRGMMSSPPRGTTPAGIENTRSPGTIRAVWVMLSFQRTTIAAPHAPAAAPTTNSMRMKTYFISFLSSGFHFFGAGGAQELVHCAGALGGAVDGHAEAVVGEPRIERGTRRQTRQPSEHDHADDRRQPTEQHHQLERDDEEGGQRRADDGSGHELQILSAGDLPPHERAPDRQQEGRGDPGEPADQREQADPAHRPVALEHLFDLVHRQRRVDREVVIAARAQLLEGPHRRVHVGEDAEDRLSGHGPCPARAAGSSP